MGRPETTATGDTTSGLRPKARKIVEAARRLFLTESYDLVTMDMIAQTAGVSKATLYAYFPSKDELFSSLMQQECQAFEQQFVFSLQPNESLEDTLTRLGAALMAAVDKEEVQCLYRLLVGEVRRFPTLALTFKLEGPTSLQARLRTFFEHAVEAGLLKIEDFDVATDQFFALTMGQVSFDRALGLPSLPPETAKKQIEGAVSMFMARYGTAERSAAEPKTRA